MTELNVMGPWCSIMNVCSHTLSANLARFILDHHVYINTVMKF